VSDPFQLDLDALPEAARRRLIRALGFAEARMPALAREELANLPKELHEGEAARFIRLRIAELEQNWTEARTLASALAEAHPDHAEFRVNWAYAARRAPGGGLAEASAILVDAMATFPTHSIFPYNLACYAAVQGERAQALILFLKAYTLTPEVLAMALEDEDLRELWDELAALDDD
jgi:Flp pilus assembly protein TadD